MSVGGSLCRVARAHSQRSNPFYCSNMLYSASSYGLHHMGHAHTSTVHVAHLLLAAVDRLSFCYSLM
jgi:hypothetical protein